MSAPPPYSSATGYPAAQPGYPPQPSYPGQPNYPNTGFQPDAQPYPPAGQPYPPAAQQYPPMGQQYPPTDSARTLEGVQYSLVPVSEQPTVIFNNAYTQPEPPPTTNYSQPEPKYGDVEEGTTEWAGDSFSEKAIRRSFIRKVYLILTCQLLITVGFILFFLLHDKTRAWVGNNPWFYYVSYGTFLVTYIALVCCPSVRRKYPGNFIALIIFTLALSYMTATISSFYSTKIVLMAAGITAAVCLAITLFAIQTKIDFTMCSGLLFAGCMVLFFFGFTCMIVGVTVGYEAIPVLHIVYSALAGLLFSLFLAYDTQMLMGGRKYELSPEEYIFGSLQLYLDVVYLFLIILSLFGSKN